MSTFKYERTNPLWDLFSFLSKISCGIDSLKFSTDLILTKEQPQGLVYAGDHPAATQLDRKSLGHAGGCQVEHEPVMCPCKDRRWVLSYTSLGKVLAAGWGKRFFLVALVKPHLECWVQVWAPQYQRGMGILEGAQQRGTTLIKGLENLQWEESYKEMLRKLGLFSLKRRLRGDFTSSCKYWRNAAKIMEAGSFQWCMMRDKGHRLRHRRVCAALRTSGTTFSVTKGD